VNEKGEKTRVRPFRGTIPRKEGDCGQNKTAKKNLSLVKPAQEGTSEGKGKGCWAS